MTDAEFLAWLNDEGSVKCALVEIAWAEFESEGGVLGFEYLSTHPFVAAPTDALPNQIYNAWIKEIPSFEQSMSEVFMGRTTANVGEVVVDASTGETDVWILDRDWIGRSLTIRVGEPSWPRADFRLIWSGVTADLKMRGTNELAFVVRDMQHLLNQPLQTAKFESGPMISQPVPTLYGTVYNVPCVLINESGSVGTYQFNDGPVASVSQIRAGGAVYASATVDLFAGTFTTPALVRFPMTADIVGATIGGSAMNNASDLIKHLVVDRGYLTIDQIDVDSFNVLKAQCPQKIGYAFPPADTMIFEAVDEICNTVGAYTAMTRDGKLYVKRFDLDGLPVMDIGVNDIVERGFALERVLAPVGEIRIGAKRNNSPKHAINPDSFSGAGPTMVQQARQHHWATGVENNEDGAVLMKTRKLPTANNNGGTGAEDQDGSIPSLFANAADAQAEAARRMALWGVRRYVFKVTCWVAPLTLKLGDVVTITHPRWGFAAGKNATIIKLRERLSRKQTELSVLV